MANTHKFMALVVVMLFCAPALAEPPRNFVANLDENCQPADIVDSFRDRFTPETFWLEQKSDFEYFIRASKTNIENTMLLGMRNKNEWLKHHNAKLKWATKCLIKIKSKLRILGVK